MPEMEKIEEPKATETRTYEILSPSAKVEAPKSQKGPGETSSATEAKEPTPLPNVEESVIMPEMEKIEEPKATETRTYEILSPSAKVEAPKSQKGPSMTPKRKRMVNVLDVLETIKSLSTTPKKIVETSEVQIEASGAEASKHQSETEAGPSEPSKMKSLEVEETETTEQILAEETGTAAPEAFSEAFDYILRHASGKKLSEKEKQEAQFYAQKLKYPKGALIFNGSGEEDFFEATKHQAETETGPSEPAKGKSLETRGKEIEAVEQILAEETGTATPEAFSEALNYILRHASGKKLTKKRKARGSVLCPKIEISKGGVDFQRQRRRRLLVLPPRQQGDLCLPRDGKTCFGEKVD